MDVADGVLVELAGQPVAAVEAHVQGEGKPGLQAQVEQAQLLVQEIEVVVEAFARFQTQHQFLLFPVAAHEVGQAGLDDAPDADEAAGYTVAAGQVAGQEFLTGATGVQIGQRALVGLGQLLGGGAHALGPAADEGGEVLEQDAGAVQVALHEARLVERAQGAHETQPIKARQNADDIGGVLSYKGRRDVAGGGVDFDFHTQVLPRRRRPVCRLKISGKAATKTRRRCPPGPDLTRQINAVWFWLRLCREIFNRQTGRRRRGRT